MSREAPRRVRSSTTSGALIKTSVQFTPEELEQIDRVAQEEGVSRSGAVARLTKLGLIRNRQLKQLAEAI